MSTSHHRTLAAAFLDSLSAAVQAATARAAAAARAELAADPTCLCGHDRSAHHRGGGRCTDLDSYGIACACPSHERHTDCDDDYDHP